MSLDLHYPDKLLPGVHHALTATSDEGPPSGSVTLGEEELEVSIIPLGPPKDEPSGSPLMKYKVKFTLPEGCAGKSVAFRLRAGDSGVEEVREVVES